MKKAIFEFESAGKKHYDENGFFKFLVNQQFNIENSKVIQWCTFNNLTITIEALSDEVIEWGKKTIEKGFKANGYIFILKS